MLIGYARVSTAEQNPDHQTDALLRAGVTRENIHVDHASGAKASRPKLDLVLRLLRDEDMLVVTRLDRLGRSVLHLVTLGAQLRGRGVGLKVVEQGIDTATAEGRAMFGMLSVLAELQRELIMANTRDGLAAARARGRRGGRPPKLTPDQVALAQRLYDAGEHTVAHIADMLGIPRSTIYGHLNKTTIGTRPHAQKTAVTPSPPAAGPPPDTDRPVAGPATKSPAAPSTPTYPPCGATASPTSPETPSAPTRSCFSRLPHADQASPCQAEDTVRSTVPVRQRLPAGAVGSRVWAEWWCVQVS